MSKLIERLKAQKDEEAVKAKEEAAKRIEDAKALDEAIKVAEAKEVLKVNAFKKCGDTGKAAITSDGKVEEAECDLELAKETLKIAIAKRIEAIKKCIDMEKATKEVDEEGAFIMEKVLTPDEAEAISEGMKVTTTKATKGSNGGAKGETWEAIKEVLEKAGTKGMKQADVVIATELSSGQVRSAMDAHKNRMEVPDLGNEGGFWFLV